MTRQTKTGGTHGVDKGQHELAQLEVLAFAQVLDEHARRRLVHINAQLEDLVGAALLGRHLAVQGVLALRFGHFALLHHRRPIPRRHFDWNFQSGIRIQLENETGRVMYRQRRAETDPPAGRCERRR